MTWTRISDDWTDRPAVLAVSRSARLLLLEMLVYANRHGTDGRIPEAAIPRLTDADWRSDLAELVDAGLTEAAPEQGAWQLDWSEQERAEQVKARQEFRAQKQKQYRHRKARHERGDHTACDPRFCTGVTSNETSNEVRNVTGLVTPSRPVPSRPLGRDRDKDPERREDMTREQVRAAAQAARAEIAAKAKSTPHRTQPRPEPPTPSTDELDALDEPLRVRSPADAVMEDGRG